MDLQASQFTNRDVTVHIVHIIGVQYVATMLQWSSEGRGPGDKPRVAQTEQTCGSLPTRARRQLPRTQPFPSSPFSFSPATNYGSVHGTERCRSPNHTNTTHALLSGQPARSLSRTAAEQHRARPPPAVSQSPLLSLERAPKQPPSPQLPFLFLSLPPLLYHVAGPSQSFSSFRACHSSLLDQ